MNGAAFRDILQDRTHKYWRTLMAICLVLIALHLVPNLDFSDLSFLGIKPGFDPDRARKIIVWVLWVLWAYHAFLFFIYYAPRDFKDWKFDLLRSN